MTYPNNWQDLTSHPSCEIPNEDPESSFFDKSKNPFSSVRFSSNPNGKKNGKVSISKNVIVDYRCGALYTNLYIEFQVW